MKDNDPFYSGISNRLILEVAKGNVGALRVIKELMYFSKWFEMMQWCASNLSGASLWKKYKDDFHYDIMKLGGFIQDEIHK